MPLELGVWRIDEKLRRIEVTSLDQEQRLEDLLDEDISIVSPNWMVIGRQVCSDYGGYIDLLTVDAAGRLAVLELKRDKTPRDVVGQLLDYASWVRHLEDEDISQIYAGYLQKYHPDRKATSLDEAFKQRFRVQSLPDSLNSGHDLVVVAATLDPSTERIISYLSEEHGVAVNAVFLRVFRDGDREYLANTWLIDPTQSDGSTPEPKEPWNGEFYVSFGEDHRRHWADAVKYGFVSAGGGAWYFKPLLALREGDRIWVIVPGRGYVGVGEVTSPALPVREFEVRRDGEAKPITEVDVQAPSIGESADDPEKAEHFVGVRWIKTVSLEGAIWEKGFFAVQNSVCKPTASSWRHTIDRLKQRFGVA